MLSNVPMSAHFEHNFAVMFGGDASKSVKVGQTYGNSGVPKFQYDVISVGNGTVEYKRRGGSTVERLNKDKFLSIFHKVG